jgi:DNA-binding NarL/FixJ family response regulator
MKTSHFEERIALSAVERRHKNAMNQLNVSLQHSIMTLAAHGWSHRRIARELDINWETVGKYLRLVISKPAISTGGSRRLTRPQNQPFRPSAP